jgi:hypothetical protein
MTRRPPRASTAILAATAALAACATPRTRGSAGSRDATAATTTANPVEAPRPQPWTLGDSIGLHVKFAEGQPESELAMLSDLGVRWARDSVGWRDIEPVAGSYRPFPAAFERRLAYYREHGIGLVFLLVFANDAAYPPTPTEPLRSVDPVRFGRYAVKIARRLEAEGVRFVLEIWNEPNNFAIRELAGGAWNGAPPSPWVAHYVRMVGEATRQVKAMDPSIVLLDDADMWILHYRYIEAGLPAALDAFAFHPYTRHQPTATTVAWYPPERATVDPDTPWVQPFAVVDDDSSFESAVRRLRDAGARALGSPPQMWITEWGWMLGDPGPTAALDEETIAAFLTRAYVVAADAGVRAVCWFSSEDRSDGAWGLIANDGRRRRAYYALRALSRQLADYVFVRRAAGGGHRTAGAQAFLFCKPGGSCTLVAWDMDHPAGRLRLSGALETSSVADLWGAPVSVARSGDGSATISVGAAPVYIRGLAYSATSAAEFPAFVERSFE